MTWVWFHRFGSPPYFYRLARRLTPWFAWPALLLCLAGLIWGLAFTPPEAHQGDGFRIIYVHVPAAWLSHEDGARGGGQLRHGRRIFHGAGARNRHALG
jgi:ABC-type transport system involved in cytochrome c biogenesis permease subunit